MNLTPLTTKEELKYELKKYKGILNKYTIEYLNALIELECSVIREDIDKTHRALLLKLELYKKITQYNIFFRTIKLIAKTDINYTLSYQSLDKLSISTKINNKTIPLFKYETNQSDLTKKGIAHDINYIYLYQTIENQELKLKQAIRLIQTLKEISNQPTLYFPYPNPIDSPNTIYLFEQIRRMSILEKELQELQQPLSPSETKEIELTNYIHNLLLEDYNLTQTSFKEPLEPRKQPTTKKLIKKLPGITIENHIKYI